MAHILSEQEAGINFGTEVTLLRPIIKISSEINSKAYLSISGDKCAPVKLKFDRAGYNHYDELYAYCFKLPSGEELWIELTDSLTTEKRLAVLKEFMEW